MADPIQPEFDDTMNALAHGLDAIFNGETLPGLPRKREVCFVLLTTKFGEIENGRVNYISNGERADCIAMLREILARFEGRYADGTTEQPQ